MRQEFIPPCERVARIGIELTRKLFRLDKPNFLRRKPLYCPAPELPKPRCVLFRHHMLIKRPDHHQQVVAALDQKPGQSLKGGPLQRTLDRDPIKTGRALSGR